MLLSKTTTTFQRSPFISTSQLSIAHTCSFQQRLGHEHDCSMSPMSPKNKTAGLLATITPFRDATTIVVANTAEEDTTPPHLCTLREPEPTPPRTKRNIAEITESDHSQPQQRGLKRTKTEHGQLERDKVQERQKGNAAGCGSRPPWLTTRLRPRLAVNVLQRCRRKHAYAEAKDNVCAGVLEVSKRKKVVAPKKSRNTSKRKANRAALVAKG
jgi:hypothetical protein